MIGEVGGAHTLVANHNKIKTLIYNKRKWFIVIKAKRKNQNKRKTLLRV